MLLVRRVVGSGNVLSQQRWCFRRWERKSYTCRRFEHCVVIQTSVAWYLLATGTVSLSAVSVKEYTCWVRISPNPPYDHRWMEQTPSIPSSCGRATGNTTVQYKTLRMSTLHRYWKSGVIRANAIDSSVMRNRGPNTFPWASLRLCQARFASFCFLKFNE